MSSLLSQLTDSPLPWATIALVAGAWLGHRFGRRRAQAVDPDLWQAVGGDPDDLPAPGAAAAQALLERARQQHSAAQRSQHLQLRTAAAEQRLATTDAVLATLQDGLLVIDGTERVLLANDLCRSLLGLGNREHATLQQATAPHAIVDGVRSVLAADLARSVKSCRVEVDQQDRRSVYLIRSTAEVQLAGARRAQVVILEDWTAEERAARAKSEFIYSVSHELKTPLTAIQASLELAAEPAGLSVEDREQLIRVSHEESVRLSQMVAELLDLARIEAGITEFKRETVNMRDLLSGLQAMHKSLADRKGITLKWNISDYLGDLVGDTRLLRQALVNVVGNALKYTKSGGEVTLTARLEGHELVTRVRDTGIGIAAEDLPRVFEKFFRAKSAQQSTIPGTGLGLPMARYILERHRGRIEIASELGVGSEFRIYLPAASGESEAPGATQLMAVDGAAG
ncbi:MAG: HAMP domain-containing histidine kinase [Planctomycetes bacterium]|jgi:signal transduction histidine kinase|nr:HAMP domain-containing histidine kinase [Planctomycetota bacterium]